MVSRDDRYDRQRPVDPGLSLRQARRRQTPSDLDPSHERDAGHRPRLYSKVSIACESKGMGTAKEGKFILRTGNCYPPGREVGDVSRTLGGHPNKTRSA